MAAPPDPSRPSIREIAAAAPPELADNPLVEFLQTMSADEEALLEHALALDLRELEAERVRLQVEESAA